MFTSFLKNGLSSFDPNQILSSIQNTTNRNQSPSNISNLEFQKILQEILNIISVTLSEKIAEDIDKDVLEELKNEVLQMKSLENNLISTKEKFNELVDKSSILYQNARKISNSFCEFLTSINLFLQSEELLIPLKEIQKGMNELLPDKVEKQMSYLIKLFQNSFEELIQKRIQDISTTISEEKLKLKNVNQNLEEENLNLKNNKNKDESKYFEELLKNNDLQEKIKRYESEISQRAKNHQNIEQSNEEINKRNEKLKIKEIQFMEKIKFLENKIVKLQRNSKQKVSEISVLNQIQEKLKKKNDQTIQQFEKLLNKKDNYYDDIIKKYLHEKSILTEQSMIYKEKYERVQRQAENLKVQIIQIQKRFEAMKEERQFPESIEEGEQKQKDKSEQQQKEESSSSKKQSKNNKLSFRQMILKMKALQASNILLESERGESVNKEMMKNLFVSYDDESKEWSIRRNIKSQIEILLGLKKNAPFKQEEKKDTKWFGLF